MSVEDSSVVPSDDGSRTVRQIAAHVGIAEQETLDFVRLIGHRDVELDTPALEENSAGLIVYQLDLRRRAYECLRVEKLVPTESIETVRERHNAWAHEKYGVQLYYGRDNANVPFFLYLKVVGEVIPPELPPALDGYPLIVGLMKPSAPPEPNAPFMPTEARDVPPPRSDD